MQRVALTLTLALLLAAAARAVKSGYRERIDALLAESAEKRKQLGLDQDREKLYAQYPTPEINFSGDPAAVACGKSAEVVVPGHFAPKTAFVVRRDDVHVSKESLDDDGWHATLRASGEALPGAIEVTAVAPVSGATSERRVADVQGKLTVTLLFEDGWRARVAPLDEQQHEVKWSKGGHNRTTRAEVRADSDGIRINFLPTDEQLAGMKTHTNAVVSTGMSPELKAAMEKLQACGKLAQAEAMECMKATQGDLQRAAEVSNKAMAEANTNYQASLSKEAWGCTHLSLSGPPSHLEGKAECAQPLHATATVSCKPLE